MKNFLGSLGQFDRLKGKCALGIVEKDQTTSLLRVLCVWQYSRLPQLIPF